MKKKKYSNYSLQGLAIYLNNVPTAGEPSYLDFRLVWRTEAKTHKQQLFPSYYTVTLDIH